MLRSRGAAGSRLNWELAEPLEATEETLEGRTVPCVRAAYDDGHVVLWSRDPIVRCFYRGFLRIDGPREIAVVTGFGEGAEAQLVWE